MEMSRNHQYLAVEVVYRKLEANAEFEDAQSQLDADQTEDVNMLESNQSKDIDDLNKAHAQAMTNLKQCHAHKITNLEKSFYVENAHIHIIYENHTSSYQQQSLESNQLEDIDDLNKAHAQAMTNLKQRHACKIVNLQKSFM
ncbi:hypothetical protein ACLB2K_064555 [Fragaria x ananassa]